MMVTRHKENQFLRMINLGVIEIDDEGRIWRLQWFGKQRPRRRAEHITCLGYLEVSWRENGTCQTARAHRIVWVNANGRIPDGLVINHRNGIKRDNRLKNLEVCTQAQNNRHACEVLHTTRALSGEDHPKAKLTWDKVIEIRSRRADGETLSSLAERFGICEAQVCNICLGTSWNK